MFLTLAWESLWTFLQGNKFFHSLWTKNIEGAFCVPLNLSENDFRLRTALNVSHLVTCLAVTKFNHFCSLQVSTDPLIPKKYFINSNVE